MENFITASTNDAAEVASWVRLSHTIPGLGTAMARKLLAHFGLPQAIFACSRNALSHVLAPRLVDALLLPPSPAVRNLIARTLDWLTAPQHYLLTLADAAYPPALLTIDDPPLLLYAAGQHAVLRGPALAVVGSRNASQQGLLHAEQFAEALSQTGLRIVSGLALGIDSAAHWGGLRGPGATVAVIGNGIDVVYPKRNAALAARITQDGCVLSEYALGSAPLAAHFPRRNRIIAGLSRGVLVIEAALRSGSLITARVAVEQGRDVFALPGSIHSPLSKGCHQLIKQGAKLVESVQDVLDELNLPPIVAAPALLAKPETLDAFETPLLAQIGFDPVTVDQLAQRTGCSMALLHGALLALELAGLVELLPGGAYRRLVSR